MRRSIVCVIAYVLFLRGRQSYSQVTSELYELFTTNSRATTGLITAVESSSSLHCATICRQTSLCKSFNVKNDGNSGDAECELLNVFPSLPGTALSAQNGFKIYEVKEKCGPCVHGNCDVGTNYQCQCNAGYSGSTCSNSIDECSSNPCQNGGTCVDAVNSYTCTCEPGLDGTHCETVVCPSNPPSSSYDYTKSISVTLDNKSGVKVYVFDGNTIRATLNAGSSSSTSRYKGAVLYVKTADTLHRVKLGGSCYQTLTDTLDGQTVDITPR